MPNRTCLFRCTPMTLRHAGGGRSRQDGNVVHRRCGTPRCPVLRTETGSDQGRIRTADPRPDLDRNSQSGGGQAGGTVLYPLWYAARHWCGDPAGGDPAELQHHLPCLRLRQTGSRRQAASATHCKGSGRDQSPSHCPHGAVSLRRRLPAARCGSWKRASISLRTW